MADYPSLQIVSSIPVTETGRSDEGVGLTGTAIAWGKDKWNGRF
jgi:hypothetical protein